MAKSLLPLTSAMRAKPVAVPDEVVRDIEALLPDLRRVARQLCDTPAQADDLVQEVLIAVWVGAEQIDPAPERLHRQVFDVLRTHAAARQARIGTPRNVA